MELLRQLLEISHIGDISKNSDTSAVSNKYKSPAAEDQEVANVINASPDYVPMQRVGKRVKNTKISDCQPITDKANNSLINTIWFMNNSDAV